MRSSPARIANAPSSVAAWPLRPPPSRPNGVRTAETMTVRLPPSRLPPGLHRTAVQPEHAVAVVDRHDVELAQHVGAEQALHTAVGIAEREVRLDHRRRRQPDLA